MPGIRALFLVVAAFFLCPEQVWAQNSIAFNMGSPSSPAAGSISATGSYTVSDTFTGVSLIATKGSGGRGFEVKCMVDMCAKTWSGQISGVPAGKWKVYARLKVLNENSQALFFDTPIQEVTVAAKG